MDRWSERDDDEGLPTGPQGKVARDGIGAFVRQDLDRGASNNQSMSSSHGKIEIVASRRQQKQQQAAAAMPPPPSRLTAGSNDVTVTSATPSTESPPSGYYIDVFKGGEAIQNILMDKLFMRFGRSQDADVVLDHPSSSRQHATISYHATSGSWIVVDHGSAHGTFVNSIQLNKGVAQPLKVSVDKVVFGASTREYILRYQAAVSSQGLSKRGGDALLGPTSKQARVEGNAMSHTVDSSSAGQFANLVRTEICMTQTTASPVRSAPVRDMGSARTKPDFQKFASEHLKRPPVASGAGLYDMLPPVKAKEVH